MGDLSEQDITTQANGCNLVHSFTLRPEVDWSKESDDFSLPKWQYTGSTAKHSEFRRFRYSSLVSLIMPITMWFADLVYPLWYLDGEQRKEPWIVLFMVLGVFWMILIPLDIYAHLTQFRAGPNVGVQINSRRWIRVRMATDVLMLINAAFSAGTYQFRSSYSECHKYVDLSGPVARLIPDRGELGYTAERNALYCQQAIQPYMAVSTLFVPMTTNLPPTVIGYFLLGRLINEIMNRPIGYALGFYSPVESTAHIFSKLFLLLLWLLSGLNIYCIRSQAIKKQFVQTVILTTEIQQAKAKEEHVDLLLSATVPPSALARLASNQPCADHTQAATVLFSDMVHFTAWSSTRKPAEVVRMLNTMTEAIDREAVTYKVEKIKTIGDAYWAVTGLPDEMEDHALVMCHFGVAMLSVVKKKSLEHPEWGVIQFRIGVHSGPLDGGILGTKMISYEVFGETSDVASLMEQKGLPSHILVSETTLEYAQLPADQLTHHQTVESPHEGAGNNSLLAENGTPAGPSLTTSFKGYLLCATTLQNVTGVCLTTPPQSKQGSLLAPSIRDNLSNYSRRSEGGAVAIDSGKQRRKAFLQQKAAAQAKKLDFNASTSATATMTGRTTEAGTPCANAATLAAGSGSEDLESIRERYTTTKWRFLFATLKDPVVEAEFHQFALRKSRKLRFWARLYILVIPVIMLVATGIEQSHPGAPPPTGASLALMFAALVCAALDLTLYEVTAYLKADTMEQWPILQAILSHVTCILLLFSSLASSPGTSVTTNSASWIGVTFYVYNLLGNGGGVIPTPWLIWGNTFIIWPIIWVVCWRTFHYGLHRLLEIQILFISGFLLSVFERQRRQQFLEIRLQEYFKQEQLKRVAEQDALLKSIVPEHISGALLTWMSGEMNTPLVRNYSNCAVAFFHLQAPMSIETPCPNPPTLETIGSPNDPNGVETDLSPKLLECPGSTVAEARQHWLADSITQVDDILQQHPAISKIKTIGDVVMLAGPFSQEQDEEQASSAQDKKTNITAGNGSDDSGALAAESGDGSVKAIAVESSDVRYAALELVRVSQVLSNVAGGVQCGIHCGPLVGAIQGTSRLCFDVFGDTVNVASRCMSGSAKLDRTGTRNATTFCAVSSETRQLIDPTTPASDERGEQQGSHSLEFEEVQVAAKGKGMLSVFFVHEMANI